MSNKKEPIICPSCGRGTLEPVERTDGIVNGCDECKYYEELEEEGGEL